MRRFISFFVNCFDLASKALLITVLAFSFPLSFANAAKINAEDVDKFTVLNRGSSNIVIDASFDDWKLDDTILFMGKNTWEANGGTWDDVKDLSAELRILYDKENIYFTLLVYDDEYVAEAATPWEDDGVQIAIDNSAGKIAPGFPNGTTHLYNFSIKDGWQKESGNYQGDAEIQMKRDDAAKQTIFEWCMPTSIFDKKGTELKSGGEVAFAIIVNDSDKNAKGQAGWIGWGSQTIVFGKNPEEMQTLVLSPQALAVNATEKLATTWGKIK